MSVRGVLRRFGWMAMLGALGSACGGGSMKVPGPLFQEAFDGAFPGTAWTTPAITGSATAAIDAATGFPMPSLKMTTTTATATAKTTTTMAFTNPTVTFSVTMADLSASATQIGTGTVTIFDATPASVAFASWDNTTGQITFHVNGAADAMSAVLAADGTFHRIVFSVDSGGNARWTLDGGSALVTHSIAGGQLKLELGASFGTGAAWPAFFFDNVTVTSP